MRAPTPPERAFAWYRETLEYPFAKPPVHEADPQCGFFERRFTAGAVAVPARIWLLQIVDQDGALAEPEALLCEIGGEAFDPFEAWPTLCENPISKQRFDHMMKVRAWAKVWRRDQPEAQPMAPVNLLTVDPPKWAQPKRK